MPKDPNLFEDPYFMAYAQAAYEGSQILDKAFRPERIHPSRQGEVLIKCQGCTANRGFNKVCFICGAKPGPCG